MAAPSRVLIEGSVILHIIKQSREQQPNAAYGKTIGHVADETLSITRCYPVTQEQDFNSEVQPQFFEGVPCGLYTSSTLDESPDSLLELLHVMSLHQRSNPSSVLILYNADMTQRGLFSIRVVRVSQKYLDLDAQGRITAEKCAEVGIRPTEMWEEVHYCIHNSHLVTAYIFEISQDAKLTALLPSRAQALNPAPTSVAHTMLERLVEKSKGSNTSLLESYTFSLDRFQRDTANIHRQKAEYAKRVEDLKIENQRRAGAKLSMLNIPDQPTYNDPSLQDVQLISVRIENAAQDLATVTELAHYKQSLLKKLITQEGPYVVE